MINNKREEIKAVTKKKQKKNNIKITLNTLDSSVSSTS